MNKQETYTLIGNHCRDNFDKLVSKMSGRFGQEADAKDIVQEGYTRALTYWDKFEEGRDFDTWFFTIMSNAAHDFYKAENLHGMTDDIPEDTQTPVQIKSIQVGEVLHKIKKKPANESRILYLSLIEGHTSKEVGEIVPESAANIRKIIQRFRDELRN